MRVRRAFTPLVFSRVSSARFANFPPSSRLDSCTLRHLLVSIYLRFRCTAWAFFACWVPTLSLLTNQSRLRCMCRSLSSFACGLSVGATDRDTGTHGHTAGGDGDNLDAPDNNGLTRGQNFMKVEKWMREAARYQQTPITPGKITNIEDENTQPENAADPPSDIDRLPQSVVSSSASGLARSNR